MRYAFFLLFGAGITNRGVFRCAFVVIAMGLVCGSAVARDDKRIDALVRLLASENFEERDKAVKELVEIGPLALEALKKAANSPDAEVMRLATECGQKINHKTKVAKLLRELRSTKEEERQAAARGLIDLGPDLAKVVPALVDKLDDTDDQVRTWAVVVLSFAGRDAEMALPKLLTILKDKKLGASNLRMRAIQALEQIGPKGRQAIPILLEILETDEPAMKCRSAQSLGGLGKDDPSVVPALMKALTNDDIRVKESTLGAFSVLRREPEKVVPIVVQLIKTYPFKPDEMYLKYALIRRLSNYGPLSEPAIPYLIDVWRDGKGDRNMKMEAKRVLVKIGPAAQKAIPGLRELGEDPSDFDFFELIMKLVEK